MKLIHLSFITCIFIFSKTLCIAHPLVLEPGEYLTQGGWGTLSISRTTMDTISFSIFSIGGNGHQCVLEGTIIDGKITLEDNDKSNPCAIHLTPKVDGIDIQQNSRDSCSIYCGARAGFEGSYLKPNKGCTTSEVSASRGSFLQFYSKKEYTHARLILESTLLNCKRTLHIWGEYWIRNDLALSQYKDGDSPSCLSTLAPLVNDANTPEGVVLENWSQHDGEIYRKILRATRTNLSLCQLKMK